MLDLHRYEESVEWLKRALISDPAREIVYRNLISALAQTGRMTEAHEHLAAYLQLRPQASIRTVRPIVERMFHPSALGAVDHFASNSLWIAAIGVHAEATLGVSCG